VTPELILYDDQMPRTYFWQLVLDLFEKRTIEFDVPFSLYIPFEDVAGENNWPRYARGDTAYLRGEPHSYEQEGTVMRYLGKIIEWAHMNKEHNVLLLNMNPFFRVPIITANLSNVYVADINLSIFERCKKFETISFPALPLQSSAERKIGRRKINISFQGVDSHPIRRFLTSFNDGSNTVIRIKDKSMHDTLMLDATAQKCDIEYIELLHDTNFALVPRGDAMFSYRLLEVMSHGCVPVIISDGWVLPFDRLIGWNSFAYIINFDLISRFLPLLHSVPDEELIRRQALVYQTYDSYFLDLPTILKSLASEMCKTAKMKTRYPYQLFQHPLK